MMKKSFVNQIYLGNLPKFICLCQPLCLSENMFKMCVEIVVLSVS